MAIDRRGRVVLQERAGTDEDERGKRERKQTAAERRRQGGERTTGRKSMCAALSLFLTIGSY
ncbi:MAG: hypothetical protein QOK34_896 [Gaiellaceae bacterium]|nr:hypothetical protein [Gaiellaceae bacterium]